MTKQFINVVKLGKDLLSIIRRIATIEGIATNRTLNIIAGRARTMIANDVNEDTGISVGTAKRRITVDEATRSKPQARLFISAARVTYPSPRRIKGGVSFIGTGKVRKKVRIRQDGGLGSRPFVIRGQYSNKKLPVYVGKEFAHKKKIVDRKVKAMYFSSLAHVARKDWQEKVNDFAIKEIRKEYPKQLEKANFRGRF